MGFARHMSRFRSMALNMGPQAFRGILGTRKGTYRIYMKHIRIPRLRGHGLTLRTWEFLEKRARWNPKGFIRVISTR